MFRKKDTSDDADRSARYYSNAWKYYKKAERLLLGIIEKNPEAQSCIQLAELYLTMEEYDEAEKHLMTAYKLDTDSASVYSALGVLYTRKNNYKMAIRYFMQAVKRNPYNLTLRSNLAEAYFKEQFVEKAEAEYRKILNITPYHVESQIGLGEVYVAMADSGESDLYEEAVKHFTLGIKYALSRRGSKILKKKNLAALYYSRGYASVQLYEAVTLAKNEKLIYDAFRDFKKSFKNDPYHFKAKRAKEKLEKRLMRFTPQRITEIVAPLIIFMLSFIVFIFSQTSFFIDVAQSLMLFSIELLKFKPIEIGSYVLLTFGSLIFMIAGLYLPQVLKLKVGSIELEKSPVEQIATISTLGIGK